MGFSLLVVAWRRGRLTVQFLGQRVHYLDVVKAVGRSEVMRDWYVLVGGAMPTLKGFWDWR